MYYLEIDFCFDSIIRTSPRITGGMVVVVSVCVCGGGGIGFWVVIVDFCQGPELVCTPLTYFQR